MKKTKISYLSSLAVILLASIYPIYMGIITLLSYFQNGAVRVEDYPKYIIPYTPLCIALLVVAALMPVIFRLCKKFALPAASIFGILIFAGAELGLEQITILEGSYAYQLDAWQYSLCYATPEVLQSIGQPIYAANNPAYKIHFYLIAVIILLAGINTVFGFYRMALAGKTDRRKPLVTGLVSLIIFIGLSVLACFTAFWRNGSMNVGPLSALCMIAFFTVFGVTFGTYIGSILYGFRHMAVSCLIPALLASITTIAMYVGELILTGGVLFRFGSGTFFQPMGGFTFAPVDIAVILLSGVLTYFILRGIHRKKI